MLTIKNIDKLCGRLLSISFAESWTVVDVIEDRSPVRGDCRYSLTIRSISNGVLDEVKFALYRVYNSKDRGYRLYNNKSMDYIVVNKRRSLKSMESFTNTLKAELKGLC